MGPLLAFNAGYHFTNLGLRRCFACQTLAASSNCGEASHKMDSSDDLDRAITLGALAMKHLRQDAVKVNFRSYGYNWCYLLEKKWLMTGYDQDKAHLIAAWTKFLEVGSSYYPDWYRSLDTENLQSRHDYQKTSNEKNWHKCHQVAEALILATHGRCDEAYATSQLGVLAYGRGNLASDVLLRKNMFEASIRHQEKAVSLFGTNEPINHGVYYCHIAYSHSMLWEIEQLRFTERMQHCNTAIEYFEKTVRLLGSENGAWKGCSDRLARLYWARWKENYKDQDVDSGISVFESILTLHPNDPHAQSGLAELYNQRAKIMVMPNAQRWRETDNSLHLLENLIVQTSLSDEALPSRLGKCSGVLADRFSYDGSVQDIDIAIELQVTAFGLPQTPHGGLWFHYAQMSHYWKTRYHHTRIPSDLTSGEDAARNSIKAAGRAPECRARGLEERACIQCISYQFEIASKDEIIDDAISNFRESMKLRPNWRSAALLRNLGGALLIRFDRGGSYRTASKGIDYLREAVDILRRLSGKGKQPDELFTVSILANALSKRHRRFGGKEDLDEAIRLLRFTSESIDEEHVRSIDNVADLCFALGLRYQMTLNDVDINEPQQRAETAISYLDESASSSERYRLENALGQAFLRRYSVKEDMVSIVTAIEHFNRCLETTSSSLDSFATEMRQLAKNNLAQAFRARAITTKARDDYNVAIRFYFQLLTESKNNSKPLDPSILECMAEVGLSLFRHGRGSTSKSRKVRTAGKLAQKAFCQLLEQGQTASGIETNAAVEAAQLFYLLDGDLENAKKYGKLALSSLTDSAMLGLSRLDHLRLVKRFSYLPSMNLCYSILGQETPGKALQDFENARTLIWNRQLNDKTPLDDLKVNHVELAQRFDKLRINLAQAREPISRLDTGRMKYTAPDDYKVALEYTEVLKEIRTQAGFEDFLLSPTNIRHVQNLASEGPIVVVNLTPWYSHTIIIQGTEIQNIELPVRDHNGKDYHEGFEVALSKLGQDLSVATNILSQVMQLLWDGIAKPVLDALCFKNFTNVGSLPQVWWITTGWLNMLPIHTAANFSDGPGGTIVDSVMDRVVSSYIPNLRALKFARKRRGAILDDVPLSLGTAVFFQMSETPGYDPLPNAKKEVEGLSVSSRSFMSVLSARSLRGSKSCRRWRMSI